MRSISLVFLVLGLLAGSALAQDRAEPKVHPEELKMKPRIDTAIEVDYYKHGGILPYVLRELISKAGPAKAKAA